MEPGRSCRMGTLEVLDGQVAPVERLHPAESDIRRVTVALRRMSKPAIAAVNGPAVGSGVGLAAGCDVRIAAREARFGWVFARRGILPDDGSLKLVLDILGYARTF